MSKAKVNSHNLIARWYPIEKFMSTSVHGYPFSVLTGGAEFSCYGGCCDDRTEG